VNSAAAGFEQFTSQTNHVFVVRVTRYGDQYRTYLQSFTIPIGLILFRTLRRTDQAVGDQLESGADRGDVLGDRF
jgi:hypothetical protein